MKVIGTSGHVDHGKSTLVAALSGINPDRLKEEREREMTIDLGFAWITLPNGEEVGIIDVPGHRDFIENMLAGVGGIDAVLLVVAADEGIMPQTREHLAIIDLLQIPTGIIVLTKTDLIEDEEWTELVAADLKEAVAGTILEDAPIVRVSAVKKKGLDDLISMLEKVLANTPDRMDTNRPRLPVDRVFTISGFGTIATGTLLDGRFRVGDEVLILPAGHRGRIRGLQTHKQKEEVSVPGSRTAVNLSGLDVNQLKRGDVVIHPGQYQVTSLVDAYFRLLGDASSSLKHDMEMKLFIGASETVCRIRLLGVEELKPGEEGWLQLELNEPVVAARRDRFILRRPSPAETIGGGIVVDPHPNKRHRRFDPGIIRQLEDYLQGDPVDIMLRTSLQLGITSYSQLVKSARLSEGDARAAVAKLAENHQLLFLEGSAASPEMESVVVASTFWSRLTEKAIQEITNYHHTYPLRKGIPREELKSKLKLQPRQFGSIMKRWLGEKYLVENGNVISHPEYAIHFTEPQKALIAHLKDQFRLAPYTPPTVKECQSLVGQDVFSALLETGDLVQVSEDVAFAKMDYSKMIEMVRNLLAEAGTLTVAEFRDRFNTSRKYALAFLEHLDTIGITRRDGDLRRAGRPG